MVKVLAFDVFGTVVDWHGTIARHVDGLGLHNAQGPVSGSRFAFAWRAGYQPAMDRVRRGELGWTRIDELHRMILDQVLVDLGIDDPVTRTEAFRAELNRIWHRLDPWPDSPGGLARLKRRFVITTLSNGNIGLLTNMAKHAGLPWDCILSAEVFRHYKPDRQAYLGVCDVFDVAPSEMLMVAAHKDDLRAAKACGCRTAYIERPLEYGDAPPVPWHKDLTRDADFDWHATDFNDLADQLERTA